METSSDGLISNFEEYCIRKINENQKFESLREEEILEKIDKLKKNCFILQIKNEIFEKYLRRHDFGALRGMEKFLKKECYGISVMERIFEEDEKITTLKSKELLHNMTIIPDSTEHEKENIGFLIKVVEQEISELCLQSKSLKNIYDKKIVNLTGELESYNCQIIFLQGVYDAIKDHCPEEMKFQAKDKSTKISELIKLSHEEILQKVPKGLENACGVYLEFIELVQYQFQFVNESVRFMENLIKNVKVQIRKTSLESFDIKKEYIKHYRDEYIEDYPVYLADVKLLELENEKLKNEFSKENQIYQDLRHLLGSYEIKLKKQKLYVSELKDKQMKLEREIKKNEKRLTSLEKYNLKLQNEVMELKAEKNKLTDLRRYASYVPTPRQFIIEHDKYTAVLKKTHRPTKN